MLDEPFLGSTALAAGVVTPAVLRSDRFVPLFRDVYVPAGATADLALRSRAGHLLVPRDGALGGISAAELLGAPCSPIDAPVEVIAPRGDVRPRRGLVVRQVALAEHEVCVVAGLRVTTPVRAAYDLGRRLRLTEAVVAIDALARVGRFDPTTLLDGPVGARGCRRLTEAVALADPLAESPMETRLRLLLVLAGLPRPVAQHRITDSCGAVLARVDLAYPAARLACEYDGEDHFGKDRCERDRARDRALLALGWTTLRFTSRDVLLTPLDTVESVRRLSARQPSTTTFW